MTTRARVAITMALGGALIMGVLLAILLQAPREVISTNNITVAQEVGLLGPHTTVCQADERLPASTAAVRVSLIAYIGPAVSVTVTREGRVVAGGHRNAGWVSSYLTLPLAPSPPAPIDATICLSRGGGAQLAGVLGNVTPRSVAATSNGRPLSGRMRVEYLKRGERSWLSLAKHVARRLGLGHAPSGTWIVLPLALMMAMAVALAAWLLMREQRYG